MSNEVLLTMNIDFSTFNAFENAIKFKILENAEDTFKF